MILQRLYELSLRERLLDDLAFEDQPVPYVIKLANNGKYLGIEERRGEITLPSKKKGAPSKKVADKGKVISIPRPHGNTANQGFARYFADTLPRVLPITDDEKSARSRKTFWQQVGEAAQETGDLALKATIDFGRDLLAGDPKIVQEVRADIEKLKPGPSDRCTFAWEPDCGRTILEREPIRAWYRQFFEAISNKRQQGGPSGICQITGIEGPIPTIHAIKLAGIPGGLPTGVSIVSYDKAAFESYGLEGTANAGIGYTAADGYARAVNALIANRLKGNPWTSLRIGNTLFLFWTREPADTGFVMMLDNPDPAQVEQLIQSVMAGKQYNALDNPNDFYLLGVSGNSARAIVREYLENHLPAIRESLAKWFIDLTIADSSLDGAGRPTSLFPLWQLVVATAAEMDQVAPDVPGRLMRAALKGDPIPESILSACIRRLRAEGRAGFRPARMALIKLTLRRRSIIVTETLNSDETCPAYVCGQLLAVFEQIQYAALGDVNANVTDKFFGTFSCAPGLVLGRLYSNVQNHLSKLRGDKPGTYFVLDKQLTEVSDKLKAVPRGQLSLEDQARFALGYYHQKAKRFEKIAERKAAKAEASRT